MITIIDFGMGNLGSIQNMLKKFGAESMITHDLEKISSSEKIILPGVGSFDRAIKNLESLGLIDILNQKVQLDKIPILGICLGMQLLAKSSEEGNQPGLGWINANVLKFSTDSNLKIPHMGWNLVTPQIEHRLFENMYENPRFYFVHSYYIECNSHNNILATSDYGITFTSAVCQDNILGVQFHPEKSHKFGMKILENFVKL